MAAFMWQRKQQQIPTSIKFGSLVFVLLLAGSHAATASTSATSNYYANLLPVNYVTEQYLRLEDALWSYLNKPGTSTEAQLAKVYNSHRDFALNVMPNSNYEPGEHDVLNHYEWSLLERDILSINGIYQFYENFLKEHEQSNQLEQRAIEDIAETVLKNDKYFSMSRIFQDIELIMVKQSLYYRALLTATDQICVTQQSTQQFLYTLYADIALTELKGYTMMEFSWMMLRIYGKGNFTQEAELMRSDFEKRTERTIKALRDVMRRADRILWRCDPKEYIKGKNYEEVTRLLQGYIENEVDLNNDETCRETCPFYQNTKSEGCFKDKFCARQPRCSGRLYDCQFVDSDMWVCPSLAASTRRYEYIEYENGVVLGKKVSCPRGTTKVDSWWRYLFWHCSYCFCLCDESTLKSDRYFNLRETLSDVEKNKVITGLRFAKVNRVFHLQIQQGELLPRGSINASTINWKPVEAYNIFDRDVVNARDFHTLTYQSRSIDLDDIHTDDITFVVTGVKFRVLGSHLNLEARLCEFNFEEGRLVNPEAHCFWKSNDNTDLSGERREKIKLSSPDVPTRTLVKSVPNSRHNQFIDFTNSDMRKDAAQSTVPFVDIQDVVSNPPVPLSGIGVYHKGRNGFGGFLAPKIITYDYTPHIQPPPKSSN